jgi:hypothetical protein
VPEQTPEEAAVIAAAEAWYEQWIETRRASLPTVIWDPVERKLGGAVAYLSLTTFRHPTSLPARYCPSK